MTRTFEVELPIETQKGQLGGVMRGATTDHEALARTLQEFVDRKVDTRLSETTGGRVVRLPRTKNT